MADVLPLLCSFVLLADVLLVEELRGETKQIFKNIQPPKPNITKEEAKAIQDLKRDKERIVLTTDKGVSMVVMDKEDYIKKSEELLPPSWMLGEFGGLTDVAIYPICATPLQRALVLAFPIPGLIDVGWQTTQLTHKQLKHTNSGCPR